MVRPAAEFMTDEALSETVHCSRCNEELVKAFMEDHQCTNVVS